jgi:uncharacterized protein
MPQMTRAFADTSFYQALLNPRDAWHSTALDFAQSFRGPVLTSEYVLCELGALMSRSQFRPLFVDLVRKLESSAQVEIVHAAHEHFEAGLQLFAERPDKDWSLTDCTSFVLMKQHALDLALATDHHFEQAGFQLILTR